MYFSSCSLEALFDATGVGAIVGLRILMSINQQEKKLTHTTLLITACSTALSRNRQEFTRNKNGKQKRK